MDDELRELLLRELERHESALSSGATRQDARRIAHGMRGALALAEEREAAAAFGRLERRLLSDEDAAEDALRALVSRLVILLKEGRPMPASLWPEPPDDLRPSSIPPDLHGEYVAQARDRTAKIDSALELRDDDAVVEIYREVHTLKGAALAVGDELMAWFCHGLEERLRSARSDGNATEVLEEVRSLRAVLGEIADAPEHAIATLRVYARGSRRPSRPPLPSALPLPPPRPSFEVRTDTDAAGLSDEASVRVPRSALDALLERAAQLALLRSPLVANAASLGRGATIAADLERQVREALRLIGPPRPWGAPARAIQNLERCAAALGPLTGLVEGAAERVAAVGARMQRHSEQISSSVHALRTSQASSLFDRVAQSALTEAKREGKLVEVQVTGAETALDRRLVEALVEPLRQLARNAVVHGLEDPSARIAAGKPEIGVIRLGAASRAGSVVLTVSDDGAGVDAPAVRRHAVEIGLVPLEAVERLGDAALLTLLFYPGFSMRREVDLLAGRGVGLDLTLAAVHRLGGTIDLDSERGRGMTATVVLPAESGLVRVLWLGAGGAAFALPVEHVGRVELSSVCAEPVVPLASVVSGALARAPEAPRLAVEVMAIGTSRRFGVEWAGPVDEVALRPLPAFVRATGPWSSGVAWADDVRLGLDPLRLVQLATTSP